MKEKLLSISYAVKRAVYALVPQIILGKGAIVRGVPHLKSYGGAITIGDGAVIEKNTKIYALPKGRIQIGTGVYFNESCMAVCRCKIIIGNNTLFGPGVYIYDHNHKFSKQKISLDEFETGDVIIEENCWIGARCIILKGAHIGKGSVVGAGTVVHGRIPPYSLVRPCAPFIAELR